MRSPMTHGVGQHFAQRQPLGALVHRNVSQIWWRQHHRSYWGVQGVGRGTVIGQTVASLPAAPVVAPTAVAPVPVQPDLPQVITPQAVAPTVVVPQAEPPQVVVPRAVVPQVVVPQTVVQQAEAQPVQPVYPAAVAPNNCTCLTKTYLDDGSVLFQDVCTREAAAASPEELQAQAAGAPPSTQTQ